MEVFLVSSYQALGTVFFIGEITHMHIHFLKLSPGIVHCKHCTVPQFTLMRMIYIYIAPFIPMDLRVPHRLKYPGLHHSNVSQPGRTNEPEHCFVLSKRCFGETGQIFHPVQTWLDLVTEIQSERWRCGELGALSAPAAGGTEVTWCFPSVSQRWDDQGKFF